MITLFTRAIYEDVVELPRGGLLTPCTLHRRSRRRARGPPGDLGTLGRPRHVRQAPDRLRGGAWRYPSGVHGAAGARLRPAARGGRSDDLSSRPEPEVALFGERLPELHLVGVLGVRPQLLVDRRGVVPTRILQRFSLTPSRMTLAASAAVIGAASLKASAIIWIPLRRSSSETPSTGNPPWPARRAGRPGIPRSSWRVRVLGPSRC